MLCFIQGRGGKGNVFVFAAGNKGPSESCSCNGYVTSIHTIAVTAATERNTPSQYTNECPAIMVTAYSGDSTYSSARKVQNKKDSDDE